MTENKCTKYLSLLIIFLAICNSFSDSITGFKNLKWGDKVGVVIIKMRKLGFILKSKDSDPYPDGGTTYGLHFIKGRVCNVQVNDAAATVTTHGFASVEFHFKQSDDWKAQFKMVKGCIEDMYGEPSVDKSDYSGSFRSFAWLNVDSGDTNTVGVVTEFINPTEEDHKIWVMFVNGKRMREWVNIQNN